MKKMVVLTGLALLLASGFGPACFGQTQVDITMAVTPELNCPNGEFDSNAGACKKSPFTEFAGDITMPITPELNCPSGQFDSMAGVCKEALFRQYPDDILTAITPALKCPGNFDANVGRCK